MTESRFARNIQTLLLLGILCVTSHCGTADPVLLLTVNMLPPSTARITVFVSQGARTGQAIFQRNAVNSYHYVPTPMMEMPSSKDSPPSTQLGVELPADLAGPVDVQVDVETGSMMAMPMKTHGACGTSNIEGGKVNSLSVSLIAPFPDCPGGGP